ncbi:hypothetical protein T01_7471 [Trichinella spiralis]|uniref:Uncharacterized protein n=1 Tax=Trichinella spiralis TaxID=6334 RepID=A0A0V1C011_TRISP|nr:hypothetical protein T01_7471 [Trichinella spiralis]
MVIWRARPSGGFFKYFIDAQLAQWRKQPLSGAQRSSVGRYRGSLGPQPGARQTLGERSGWRCAGIALPPSATVGHHQRGWGHADGVGDVPYGTQCIFLKRAHFYQIMI